MANGTQLIVKISGYLEKKAKLRIGSPWKKYWFVLEGRLLLYYRSKDEYEALSPCKGSINLCPPCNVKPALSAACVFQIECRANTVTLRAESRPEQERWLQAILAAIAQSKSSPSRMSHFRYSLDDLPTPTSETKPKKQNALSRQNTMPFRISSSPRKDPKDIIGRLQQMGAQSYGGSLGAIAKLANKEHQDENISDSTSVCKEHNSSCVDVSCSDANDTLKSSQQSFKLKSQSTERVQSLLTESEQYSIIQEENSMDLFLNEHSLRAQHPEKISSIIVENDQYDSRGISVNDKNPVHLEADKLQSSKKKESLIVENDQYSRSSFKGTHESEENFVRDKGIVTTEHLYERISSDSVLSDFNTQQMKTSTGESACRIKQNIVNFYERISSSSSNSESQIKTNEQYSVIQKDVRHIEKESFNMQKTKINKNALEHEYSVPINFKNENTDHNKNSLIIDNDQYVPAADDKSNDNPYSNNLIYTAEYIEYDAIDKSKEQEALYEDPDGLKKHQREHQSALYHDVEPMLPPRPESKRQECEETSSQASSNDDKCKKKKSKFKILAQLVKSDRKSDPTSNAAKSKPKKRSTSFIRRVWRRKAKSLDEEDMYETVDYELIEKQVERDKNDLQMLQELQKILETRKNMLQVKLNSSENKGDNAKTQAPDGKVLPIAEEKEEESTEIRTEKTINEQRPLLPPRQSTQSLSPYHDVPKNNKALTEQSTNNSSLKNSTSDPNYDNSDICNSAQPGTKSNVKTIDEILEDLDKEKDIQESRQKVKQLIEKFNDIQNEEEVVLRRKPKLEIYKSQSDTTVLQTLARESSDEKMNREANELTKLLEELSKVTCAPVLTPGVTSSLVTPTLTDDEWLQLIPIRRRRLSDPDYDVPRPHRSLQLQGRSKPENPIPATRFFGPILPPTSTNDTVTRDTPSFTSIDPDSLENLPPTTLNCQSQSPYQANTSATNTQKDQGVTSYTSHHYETEDKVIYAQPKTVMLNTKFSSCKDETVYSNTSISYKETSSVKLKEVCNTDVDLRNIDISEENLVLVTSKSEETFIDSLEPLTELSTAF